MMDFPIIFQFLCFFCMIFWEMMGKSIGNDGKIPQLSFFLRKILEPVLFGIFRPTMFGDRRAFAKSPPPGVPIPSHCASCLIGVPTIGNSHHPPI